MDGADEFCVFDTRVRGLVIRHELGRIPLIVATAATHFDAIRRAKEIAGDGTDVDVRAFRIDASDRAANSDQRELREVLRRIHRKLSLEEGQEWWANFGEELLRRDLVPTLRISDQP